MSDIPGLDAHAGGAGGAGLRVRAAAPESGPNTGSARGLRQDDRARRVSVGARNRHALAGDMADVAVARARAGAARRARRGRRAARQRDDVHDRRADLGGSAR